MSSRIAQNDVRKIKLFQKNLYTTIDLLKGSTEIYKVEEKQKIELRHFKICRIPTQWAKEFYNVYETKFGKA